VSLSSNNSSRTVSPPRRTCSRVSELCKETPLHFFSGFQINLSDSTIYWLKPLPDHHCVSRWFSLPGAINHVTLAVDETPFINSKKIAPSRKYMLSTKTLHTCRGPPDDALLEESLKRASKAKNRCAKLQ
jgi:hypothetical protein